MDLSQAFTPYFPNRQDDCQKPYVAARRTVMHMATAPPAVQEPLFERVPDASHNAPFNTQDDSSSTHKTAPVW